jgi:predicted metal-dependent hydrolase
LSLSAPRGMEELEAGLREAARLFNEASYHAAHEVLDGLWEEAPPGDADLLKGLIQACIALHHYQQGNLEGARRLYSGHRRYLGGYIPAHLGVDVAGFMAQMQAALLPLVRARPGEEPPFEQAPRPSLEIRPGA